MRRLVLLSAALGLIGFSLPQAAYACSCAPASASAEKQAFDKAEIVARIRILESTKDIPNTPYISYAAETLTTHKGRVGGKFTLREGNNSCANFLAKGQTLDVAMRKESGRYVLEGQCTQMTIQEYLRKQKEANPAADGGLEDGESGDPVAPIDEEPVME